MFSCLTVYLCFVVSTVPAKFPYRISVSFPDLINQANAFCRVVDFLGGYVDAANLETIAVDDNMNFLPFAPLGFVMCANLPFSLSVNLQSNQQVNVTVRGSGMFEPESKAF